MKIRENIVVRKVADSYVAVPTGKTTDGFNGIARLNKTGYDIWCGIAEGLGAKEIAQRLVESYDGVTLEEAEKYTLELIEKMRDCGAVYDE